MIKLSDRFKLSLLISFVLTFSINLSLYAVENTQPNVISIILSFIVLFIGYYILLDDK